MKTSRILKMLTVAAAMFAAIATSSTAMAGPVNQLLTGGVIDPMATTLKVAPPKGGMVMVHQRGQAVAWFSRAGFVNLKPNQIYTITATRGRSLLFTGNVMMRRGYTEAIWGQSNTPAMSYVPTAGQGFRQPPARIGVRHPTPRHRSPKARTPARSTTRSTTRSTKKTRSTTTQTRSTTTRTRLNGKTHRALVTRLTNLRTDRQRLRVVTRYNQRYRMTASQKRTLTRTFQSTAYRAKASSALGTASRATTKRPATKRPATKRSTVTRAKRTRRTLQARR